MERSKSMKSIGSFKDVCSKPSPDDFIEFFPWACKQYEVNVTVESVTYEEKKPRKTKRKSLKVAARNKSSSSSSFNLMEDIFHDDGSIGITAVFDQTHNLISIKIENNVEVPKTVFQVIALIVEFYPSLTSLTADKGLDAYCIHEISKILLKSSITEVCLDKTCLANPNYYVLLETVSNLTCLSLARCQISDEITKRIAETLAFPHPASKTLTFLNLSSNRITDAGAVHLADALKTNRHLAYLNLADNSITDTGATHIFDIMLDFPMLDEDLKQFKIRRKEYLLEKNKLFHKCVTELKIAEETKPLKRKGNGKLPVGRGRTNKQTEVDQHKDKDKKTEEWPLDKVASLKMLAEVKLKAQSDVKFFDRAEKLALKAIGPFEDPFGTSFVDDEIAYCKGNNTLICLNLAFNNLSYISLQKLIEVLNYQKDNHQIPKGLFRVRLEGNYLPSTCEEYTEIQGLLDLALEESSKLNKSRMRTTKTKHKFGNE